MYDYQTMQRFWERFDYLEKEVQRLRKVTKELQEKVDGIKPVKIDRIEYKIHELNIDTLSGTLNVGLTAQADEEGMGDVIEKIIEKQKENILEEINTPSNKDNPPADNG